MVAKTRSQTRQARQIEKSDQSRRKVVWEALKLADAVRAFVLRERDTSAFAQLDIPELGLLATVYPLPAERRKILIDGMHFTC